MSDDKIDRYLVWWVSKFTMERKRMGGPLLPRRELRVAKCDCCGRTHETEAKLFAVSYCEDCADTDARWIIDDFSGTSML